MKEITLFHLNSCPYCVRARGYMQELYAENPAYKNIPIQLIEESQQPDVADRYDYFYVPCYYVDGKKVAEGVLDKEAVKAVFEEALA